MFTLGYGIVLSILYFLAFSVGAPGPDGQVTNPGPFFLVIGLILLLSFGLFIPSVAVLVRRLHDTGRSGWLILLSFVPVIGGILLLVFVCQDGTPGPNQYGESPKAEHSAEVFA